MISALEKSALLSPPDQDESTTIKPHRRRVAQRGRQLKARVVGQAKGVPNQLGAQFSDAGAHGLYPSRNARLMYVSNREQGSISVVSFRTRRVVHTWQLPLPASPDMGGVSADGRTLWLSGRYNAVVYAIDTRTGHLRTTIPVGEGPHGLCVWPQPGRYSLGHTGILR